MSWLDGAKPVDDRPVVIGGMFAVHGGENPVGTGLNRKMHERHQRRQIAVRFDQRVVDVAGMAGRIAQAGDAGNIREPAQQAAQRPGPPVRTFAVIGVDVLADQRDFAHAVVGEPQHVVDDLCDRTRYLGAPRIGHHAEGAELVASFLNGDEGGNAARANRIGLRRGQKAELVLDGEFGLDGAAIALRPRQQLRQMMVALRADDDVDHRGAADDFLAFRLRDAAGHRDVQRPAVAGGFILGEAQPAELRVDLLGGLFADVTGVEDHQIRVIDAGGLDKAFRPPACPPCAARRRRSSDSHRT